MTDSRKKHSRYPKLLTAVLLCIMVFLVSIDLLAAAAINIPRGYNADDYLKMRDFLEQWDGRRKNGEKISPKYDPDDPASWEGVIWIDAGEKRLFKIDLDNKYLTGTLDLSGCSFLETVNLYHNRIEKLILEDCTGLIYCNCMSNMIHMLDVSGCLKLEQLYCLDNQLRELALVKLPELKIVCAGNNNLIYLDISGCENLETLVCTSNQLKNLVFKGNRELREVFCANNLLKELDLSSLKKLEVLDCSSNLLESLDVGNNFELVKLICNNNNIKEIKGMKYHPRLEEVFCKSNSLVELNFEKCTAIKKIDCQDNELEDLIVTDCDELDELYCSSNFLSKLDLSTNTNLRILHCDMNQLSDLDLGFAGNLTHLNCSKNNLSELVINSTELQEVDCSYNQLQRLEIADPAKLFSLDCSYNRLTFATLPILETYTIYNYLYQDIIIIGNDGKLYVHEEVDFSAEAVIDGVRTEFRWYGVGGPVSPTTENNGNFTFGYNFIGELIYCEFTNNKFPGLVLDTTEVRVLPPAPGQKSR